MNRVRHAAAALAVAILAAALPAGAADYQGLWVGSAVLDRVNEINSATPGTVSATASPLELVLILHVSGAGEVRLLKEVYQVWKDGILDADGSVKVAGTQVLLADDALIPCYKGVAAVDGTPVGRRISSIGFDFEDHYVTRTAGAFGVAGSLSFAFTLPADHPTNPYLHRYHPDHDNLGEDGTTPAAEAPAIVRGITLSFDGAKAVSPPDYGSRLVTGTYRESLAGLTRATAPVIITGAFTLKRVSDLTLTEACP